MDDIRRVIARWQFKQQWNFGTIPGSEEFRTYSTAVFAAASGDGVIAPQERAWVIGYFASLGMPDDGIAMFKSHDPTVLGPAVKEHLGAFLRSPAGPFNRGLVYDCIRAARADASYNATESARVHEIGAELSIADTVIDEIEEICRLEQRAKSDKLRFFYPDGIPYMSPLPAGTPEPASARDLIAAWHFEEEWGFLQVPAGIEFQTYAQAVLAAASGDGVLAPEEREWIVGYFASLGASNEVLEFLNSANPSDVDLQLRDHLHAFSQTAAGPFNRGLIYDCIRAAAADGDLEQAERDRCLQIATDIGIDETVAGRIEEIHNAEQATKKRRLALFFPDSTPFSIPA